MASLFHAYMNQLRINTLRTQMLTSAVVMGLGNVITQQAVNRRGWGKHDWKSTARFSFYGCFFFTPLANRWHYLMNRIKLSTGLRTISLRLAIDMSVFAPMATTWFFLWMGVLEGRRLPEIRQRLEQNFQKLVVRQWAVFGPAQAINMSLVPVYARPPVMNMVGLAWSTYLSLITAELNAQSEQGSLTGPDIAAGPNAQKLEKIEVDRLAAAVME